MKPKPKGIIAFFNQSVPRPASWYFIGVMVIAVINLTIISYPVIAQGPDISFFSIPHAHAAAPTIPDR